MPPAAVFLDFPRSDGDRKSWPPNTTQIVDRDGTVNFYKPIPEDVGASLKWKHQIAMKVAEKMGLESGKNYVFRKWPDGYGFFDHHKGAVAAPRHDAYLIGCVHVPRFRSIPEFVAHAHWLMTDPTLDRANCECKYCTKTPQRQISARLGYTQPAATPGPSHPSRNAGPRARRVRQNAPPYAVVQKRKVKPPPPPPTNRAHSPPRQHKVHNRYDDVQAMYADLGLPLRRWFREGELIWVALQPPIFGDAEDINIAFWPALVKEHQVRSEAIPRDVPPPPPGPEDAEGAQYEDASPTPWTVEQHTEYTVKLLGINYDTTVLDANALPYVGYTPTQQLLNAMGAVPPAHLTLDAADIASFVPCPPDVDAVNLDPARRRARFRAAVAPYSIALQTANTLTHYWTPTDEWECRFAVPPPSPASAAAPETGVDARGHSSVAPGASADELRRLTRRIVGTLPASGVATQTRYQGLWWGSERIWVDELVRLKASRRQLAPQGAPHIFAPSGPSAATLAVVGGAAPAPGEAELGAIDRGLFLRLDALFVVDVPDGEGGSVAEARASGTLYELADEDWEETEARAQGPSTPRKTSGEAAPAAGTIAAIESTVVAVDGAQPTSAAPSSTPPPPPPPDISAPPILTTTTTTTHATPSTSASASKVQRATSVPLPAPPENYKFRPILAPGHEVVISLTLISGRYYPALLSHPLLRPILQRMFEDNAEAEAEAAAGGTEADAAGAGAAKAAKATATAEKAKPLENQFLLSLAGLSPGFGNSVEPYAWSPSRTAAAKEADKESERVL
ncbi:hypothetical protein OF83DRAFT_1031400, partial [Amylostereum chailletii]